MKKKPANELPTFQEGTPYKITVRGRDTLEISAHAEKRMLERGISLDAVVSVLNQPSATNLRADPPYKHSMKTLSAKQTLHVVFWEKADRIVVISTYKQESN